MYFIPKNTETVLRIISNLALEHLLKEEILLLLSKNMAAARKKEIKIQEKQFTTSR
jgi:hypothetical protein